LNLLAFLTFLGDGATGCSELVCQTRKRFLYFLRKRMRQNPFWKVLSEDIISDQWGELHVAFTFRHLGECSCYGSQDSGRHEKKDHYSHNLASLLYRLNQIEATWDQMKGCTQLLYRTLCNISQQSVDGLWSIIQ